MVRELSGLSQRQLAARTDTSQPNLASLETGNRIPTVRTLMRIADAAGFELVIGLRHPDAPTPDPDVLHAEGFDLVGTCNRTPRTAWPTSWYSASPAPSRARPDPASSAGPAGRAL
ncbi:MAG TPA: helix-turn-helix transcriptional regulator, partial [Actinomycetota bacterium]|nr:helix-turn-helix transcriptional regulator [Actinomycetota bacterium]